jgi:hypothetical protein
MTTREFTGNQDHLEILKQGVEAWNRWRAENPDVRPDLRGADLFMANLSQANLRGADLRQADLARARLYRADFSQADLRGANLSQANLVGANLRGADLGGANLDGAIREEAPPASAIREEASPTSAPTAEAPLEEASPAEKGFRGWSPAKEAFSPEPPADAGEAVDFTVFHVGRVLPRVWTRLLAYVHLSGVFDLVLADSRRELGAQAEEFVKSRDHATQLIRRESEIALVPELPGFRFNPPRASVLWLEAWHRADFRMQAGPDLAGFQLDRPLAGRVAFYVGPVLVGEVPISVYVCGDESGVDRSGSLWEREAPTTRATAGPYRSVFVSYSHKDAVIVDGLEKAYTALGDTYLRDVRTLRSGEQWNRALLGMIEQADIFQLCWSNNARASRYVEQEWQHALGLGRPNFIRPVYWEDPMPEPPAELSDIHFAHL